MGVMKVARGERRAAANPKATWLENPVGATWHLLTSVRLALVLILLIAAAVLAGTLINQAPAAVRANPDSYQRWLDAANGRYGSWTGLMDRLQLFHVFSSIWFRLLVAALAANIIVCSVNRWTSIKTTVFNPRVRMHPAFFERSKVRAAFAVELPQDHAVAALRKGLKSGGYRMVAEDGETTALYADRFRLSRFGTFLTHLSLVLLLAGAILGQFWGWKDDQFVIAEGATKVVPMAPDLSVKLDQFQEEWYVEGPPKDYASEIVIYKDGQEVKRGTTRVNAPVKYNGIKFNQAFYGNAAVMQVRDANGTEVYNEGVPLAWRTTDSDRPVGYFEVPGEPLTAYVVGPDTSGGYDRVVPLGTMRLELHDKTTGRLIDIQSLQRNKPVNAEGLTFTFLRETEFSGLKIVKDPGVNIVWLASGLMVLGLVMVFWFPHRRLWALVSERSGGGADVRLAASSQRDMGLEKDFETVAGKVRHALAEQQREERRERDV